MKALELISALVVATLIVLINPAEEKSSKTAPVEPGIIVHSTNCQVVGEITFTNAADQANFEKLKVDPRGWLRELSGRGVSTGMQLGYAIAQRGGTRADIERLAHAAESNDLDTVSRWLRGNP